MLVTLIFLLFTIAVVAFHFYALEQGFWFPVLASNWALMDLTTKITLAVSAVVFIVISVFVCYCIFRFRRREGHSADHEPENSKENSKLEGWLTIFTTVGVIALLSPGLMVYRDFINPPADAIKAEVLGEQWTWSYRFPGNDGIYGRTNPKFFSLDNSFGLDPSDPASQDDVLVNTNTVHFPINQPVDIQLRSKDVLHDFYIPQFRAKIDMVPGQVTKLWFEPTLEGEYEIVCAEYCGIAHYNMRGIAIVNSVPDFQFWLDQQQTFGELQQQAASSSGGVTDKDGELIARTKGCIACHSIDGKPGIGPSWKGIAGEDRVLVGGGSMIANDLYLKRSITNPNDEVVLGYAPMMPPYPLSEEELDAIVEYINSLGE